MSINESAVERLGRLQDDLQHAMCNDDDLTDIKAAIEQAHIDVYAEQTAAELQLRDNAETVNNRPHGKKDIHE
jgi:hypothetical protein